MLVKTCSKLYKIEELGSLRVIDKESGEIICSIERQKGDAIFTDEVIHLNIPDHYDTVTYSQNTYELVQGKEALVE